MKKFIVSENKYLSRDVKGYYNCDYIGYQKDGNPDFINNLKNMSNKSSELDLVADFIAVSEKLLKDLKKIIDEQNYIGCTICTVPRSKTESKYHQSQLLFKKAVASAADNIGCVDGTSAIRRVKDTKTTHNWRLSPNYGDAPYGGITKDTCAIDEVMIRGKNIILVDDIYCDGVNVVEDCIQALFDFGAENVILYVIAKTKG